MRFLKNAWYCAAWTREVGREPLSRTLLNQKVVLYRKEDGGIVALSDICPHRFALMHKGRVHGDAIACPYHGLQFGTDGQCVHNPHGEVIPPALKLSSFPIVERHAVAWIWMGDPELADPETIPDFSMHDDPDYALVGGRIPIRGAYQLVADNLLDLSHTQYLHPVLTAEEDPDTVYEYDIVQDGDMVTTIFNTRNLKPFGFVNFIWPDAPARIDSFSGIRWEAPGNMLLKIHFVSLDPVTPKELRIWGAELVTPETETTCHYFWGTARNFRQDDEEFGKQLGEITETVFTNEDGGVIADIQENMGDETDLIALRPVVLPTDQAAIRTRNIVKKLLKQESAR
tara:strand:+ start:9777 stop:10802 length:1026 start_codon:yes stop_codon:yes gene_type:complete